MPFLLLLGACQAAPAPSPDDPRIADLQRRLTAVEAELKAAQGQARVHDLWIKSLMDIQRTSARTSAKPTPLWDDRTHSLEGRVDDLEASPRFKP